jgi:MYXO-CTERM domain-containing protein
VEGLHTAATLAARSVKGRIWEASLATMMRSMYSHTHRATSAPIRNTVTNLRLLWCHHTISVSSSSTAPWPQLSTRARGEEEHVLEAAAERATTASSAPALALLLLGVGVVGRRRQRRRRGLRLGESSDDGRRRRIINDDGDGFVHV